MEGLDRCVNDEVRRVEEDCELLRKAGDGLSRFERDWVKRACCSDATFSPFLLVHCSDFFEDTTNAPLVTWRLRDRQIGTTCSRCERSHISLFPRLVADRPFNFVTSPADLHTLQVYRDHYRTIFFIF